MKGGQREHFTDVGGAGHFATDNLGYDIGSADNKDVKDNNCVTCEQAQL